MVGRRRLPLGLATLAVGLVLGPIAAPAQDKVAVETVKIGMVSTLFRDVSPAMVQIMMPPFQTLMRAQTGLEGEFVTVANAQGLGGQLSEGQVQLGVFHGFEFAWAQQKYPDLRPLVIAVNRLRTLHAYLVVRSDAKVAGLADLRGKTLALPRKTREHCVVFLERECRQMKCESKEFFGKIVNHSSIEDALDDVLRDNVQAALVEGVSLDSYNQVKPGCFARLKVLKQSEGFPASVVAYRQGAIDDVTLAKFREGMITANQNARGKELMAMWKLTAFENVPADFQQSLDAILKAYPAPATGGAGRKKVRGS
jgi:ABC-type phosphate/phosphonate transport system substrate-binding protein